MLILVPFKPVALVLGCLSAMIFCGYSISCWIEHKDPFKVDATTHISIPATAAHPVSATVRLDETTATQVDQYAAFIHASADDVVDKALTYVFSKDRDFQEFLRTTAPTQTK